VVADECLSPLDDVEPVAESLAREGKVVMLVGHLPFMERMAGHLVAGDAEHPVVKFHNGGVVCLEQGEPGWQVSWIVTPAIAGM
jgi:phosphohistidine phosphatase